MKQLAFLLILLAYVVFQTTSLADKDEGTSNTENNVKTESALFAGGCFWCIEADFEKLDGVVDVVSGYTGGSEETAQYKTVTYTETGHFEAVEVTFDPSKVSYAELVEYFWRHIDPTDPDGQFCDKGSSYRSGVFYQGEAQKAIVDESLEALKQNKPFAGDIVTTITEAKPFYLAEKYHQDYYKKNPIRYRFYRNGCGRDKRVKELWGEK